MLLSLLASALAATLPDPRDPHVGATVDVVETHAGRKVIGAMHVGFDVAGANPGISARFDFGHRVSVEGSVFGVGPGPEALTWTGGGSIGLQVAPLRVQLGTRGTLDLRLGVGMRATGAGGGSVTGGGLDLGGWGSGLLELSPTGDWSIYGGLLALEAPHGGPADLVGVPAAGVRFKLE